MEAGQRHPRGAASVPLALAVLAIAIVPGTADAAPRCAGKKATIVGGKGRNVLKGTARPDVIVAGRGNDRIVARGGRDVVCAGSGRDRISGGSGRDVMLGGPGKDLLSGGNGRDKAEGGSGADTILGGPGGEFVLGGSGPDRIFAGQQDDEVRGGPGDDLVVGDHGEDGLHGNGGQDWLRGDSGTDHLDGGPGDDWGSWATSRGIGVRGQAGSGIGELQALEDHTGFTDERATGVENVLGTPGYDSLHGKPDVQELPSIFERVDGNGFKPPADGEDYPADDCIGFRQMACAPFATGDSSRPVITQRTATPDPGLYILGSPAADAFEVSRASGGLRIAGLAGAATPSPDCAPSAPGVIDCALGLMPGHIVVDGLGGNDSIVMRASFGGTTTVVLNGGRGADRVQGGSGDEILDAYGHPDWAASSQSAPGTDVLLGGGGDDALLGNPVHRSRRDWVVPSPDVLRGGPGSDQLVLSSACGGHVVDGGPGGSDIAGFAKINVKSQTEGIRAQIGGSAYERLDPGSSNPCPTSRVSAGNEILEGTRGDDILMGNGRANYLIIGHGGNDLIKGFGGYDRLRGDEGVDILLGGGGPDVLEANDDEKDKRLSCGGGGGRAERDRFDPPGKGCGR